MTTGGRALIRDDTRLLAMLATAPALLLLAFQATWPWPFFSDDSFISLRYAERLLQGDGLTFTDGERVEGYSNLLWVLLTAGLGALGMDLVAAARLLGAGCTMLSLWWLAKALRPNDLRTTLTAAVPPLLVASSQTVLVWTLGGLEGPLVLLLLAWGFGGLARACYQEPDPGRWPRRELLWLGLPFALGCLTRPDGPSWALTAGIGLAILASGNGVAIASRRAFWFGLPSLLLVFAQLMFRLAYYGAWVPNTAHVKAEFDLSSFGPGFTYVHEALAVMPGLAALALLGALLLAVRARPRAFVFVLALPLLAWATYLSAIGGDHFPGRRLMHGALAPMALLAGLGLRALGRSTLVTVIAVVLGLGAATADVWRSRTDGRSHEAKSEVWEWHGKALGEALGRAFHEQQPLVAVDAAGAIPFYSRLPALDMLGLCDRTIATTPFASWLDTVRPGTPKPPGHLRGNGDYVMQRQPDLLLFRNAPPLPLPVFVSACEFESDPRFVDGYRAVLLDLGAPEILPGRREPHLAPVWVRLEGRAGIERSDERIAVPAFLFGSWRLPGPAINRWQPPTGDAAFDAQLQANTQKVLQWLVQRTVTAVPTGAGPLALALPAGERARFTLSMPAGHWRLRCEPADCGAMVSAIEPTASATDGAFVVTSGAEVTLELRAADGVAAQPTHVVLESRGR